MSPSDKLIRVLLDLGLEDLVPTAEAAMDPEVVAAVSDRELIPTLSQALRRLAGLGELRIYRGHRHADAEAISDGEAQEVLADPIWYAYHLDDPEEERLYFVNVENLRDGR